MNVPWTRIASRLFAPALFLAGYTSIPWNLTHALANEEALGVLEVQAIVPSSFISRRIDPIECVAITQMAGDKKRSALSRRELGWTIAGLFGFRYVATGQKEPSFQDSVITTIRQVSKHAQSDRWITSKNVSEVITIMAGFARGTYGVTTNGDPHMPVARAEDPPSRNLSINSRKYAQISDQEREPIIAHEMFHFGSTQRARTKESIGIMGRMPRSFNGVLSSADYQRDFKRSLALDVQNETEAVEGDTSYRIHLAKTLGFKNVRDYFNDLIQHTPVPDLAGSYRIRLGLLALDAQGQFQLDVDGWRLQSLRLLLTPDLRDLLVQIARNEKVNVNDGDAMNKWALSWLKDPAYYNPPSGTLSPREKAEISRPIDHPSPILAMATGVLNDGRWSSVPSENSDVDLYQIEYGGKHITVLAEAHPSGGAHREVAEAMQAALTDRDPSRRWHILQETYLSPSIISLVQHAVHVSELPSIPEGAAALRLDHALTLEQMMLGLTVHFLNDWGITIEEDNVLFEQESDPLWASAAKAIRNLKSANPEDVKSALAVVRPLLTLSREAIQRLCDEVNTWQVFMRSLARSNELMAAVIRQVLDSNATHLVIHFGKGHLLSIINDGPIASGTIQRFYPPFAVQWQHVYKALHPPRETLRSA